MHLCIILYLKQSGFTQVNLDVTMKRYILTGAPGAGKTTLIEQLKELGYPIVRESFMYVYKEFEQTREGSPFDHEDFLDEVAIDQLRQADSAESYTDELPVFFDRAPLCTKALGEFMGRVPGPILQDAITYSVRHTHRHSQVFLVKHLDFCEQTDIRKISMEDVARFENLHRKVYESYGYPCIAVPNRSVSERLNFMLEWIT